MHRTLYPSSIGRCVMGQAVHTALMLYLNFIATALPSASYDATAASPPPPHRPCSPPRRGGNGGGVGSAVGRGGGWGGGRLGDLPAPAGARRRRRRSRQCSVDGGVVDGCVGGCLFVPGGELNEIKKSKKNVFALYGRLPVIQTQQPTKNTRTRRRR